MMMEVSNIKKHSILTGILFVWIVGTLFHYVYEWSGNNPVIGLISPVNESVWEHMKLIFFPMLIFGLLIKDEDTDSCQTSSYFAGMLAGTIFIPVVFYSYTALLGQNYPIFDILLFFISVIVAFATYYYLANRCLLSKYNGLLFSAVFLLLVCFLIFTYAPPPLFLFQEP
jgi:hypothetical protein